MHVFHENLDPDGIGDATGCRLADRRATQSVLVGLVGTIRAGGTHAFERLYDHTVERVFALAQRLLRSRDDAEEVVSEVYLQAYSQAHRYDPERGDVLAWLLTICHSRCIDVLRDRRKHTFIRQLHEPSQAGGLHQHFEPPYEMMQPGHVLTEALSSLPPLRQRVLALAFCHGLSYSEIAEQLSLPLGSVKSHARRAILDLRAALRREDRWHE